MVKSKEDKGTTHSFIDYAYSREVVRDFPKLIHIYDNLLKVLYPYAQYTGAWGVIQSVEDCKTLLEIQLDYYQRVFDSKGKVKDDKRY